MTKERPISAQSYNLSSGLDILLQRLSLCRYQEGLVRIEVGIQPLDCLQWLANLPAGQRCYFARRDQALTLAGIGQAKSFSALSPSKIPNVFAEAESVVKGSNAYWIGGCSFNGRAGAYQWQGFAGACFVLPLVEVRQSNGVFSLAFNLYAESFAQWQEQQLAIHGYSRQMCAQQFSSVKPVGICRRKDSVEIQQWQAQVEEALTQIQHSQLEKVVLAREVTLELSRTPDALMVLAALEETHPECYSFAIEKDGKSFFGCSPEQLIRRRGKQLSTEALAGTVRRGETPREDQALEAVLREDPKLILEHKLVAQAIEESLLPVASAVVNNEQVKILKLSRIQHRCQPLSAQLNADTATGEVYRCLHPTPAICGYPAKNATAFINDIEAICRGWYSGSVGIIGDNDCELSVAIRSALAEENRLWLYSGVGIVAGSNAEEEWQELESKLESMLQAVGNKCLASNCNAH